MTNNLEKNVPSRSIGPSVNLERKSRKRETPEVVFIDYSTKNHDGHLEKNVNDQTESGSVLIKKRKK